MSAFRGAVGWGKDALVDLQIARQIHVTNLNASGAGSLADALSQSGHRVIIFDVAGTITLNATTLVANPNFYIAGQTAPGDGICIKGATERGFIRIRAAHGIIRGIRFRTGVFHEGDDSQQGLYCVDVTAPANNVIFDHCSFSFTDDTALQFWNAVFNATVQNCIFSFTPWESLNLAGGPPYGHHISVIGNIFAHSRRRVPNTWAAQTEIANNVIYNARAPGGGSFKSGATVDLRGNVVLPGVNTGNAPLYDIEAPNGLRVYVNDNQGNVEAIPTQYRSTSPVASSGYEVLLGNETLDYVLANAGALPHDAIDQRVIDDILDHTGAWIQHQREVGGYPVLTGVPRTQAQWDAFVQEMGGIEEALDSFYAEPEPVTIDNAYWDVPSAFVGDLVRGTAEISNAEGLGVSFVVIDTVRGQVDATTSVVEGGVASFTFTPLQAGSFLFRVTCDGVSSDSPELPVAVRIPAPTLSFTVSPTSIRRGQSARLTWASTNMATLFLSSVGPVSLNGSRTVSPRITTTYTLTGTGLDGSSITRVVQLRVTIGNAVQSVS